MKALFVLTGMIALAAPAVAQKRPATVFTKGSGALTTRLDAALRAGIADSPRFRTPRSRRDDDVQFVFTAPPRPLAAGRFAYAIDVMQVQGGAPMTVTALTGACRRTQMTACSSMILAHAAHALGY